MKEVNANGIKKKENYKHKHVYNTGCARHTISQIARYICNNPTGNEKIMPFVCHLVKHRFIEINRRLSNRFFWCILAIAIRLKSWGQNNVNLVAGIKASLKNDRATIFYSIEFFKLQLRTNNNLLVSDIK